MAEPSEDIKEREPAAGHVGALLRASRQRLNEDLPDVALMLRIRLPYLEAIEAGRYRDLPGATYAVGFIRAYAEHLGLDSEEVVRRFKAETTDGGADQKLSFPTPVPETGIPGGAYVFIGLVIAVLAYGGWYISTTDDGFFAELISPLDEQLTDLLEDDTVEPTPEPQPPVETGEMTESAPVAEDEAPTTEEVVPQAEPEAQKPVTPEPAQNAAEPETPPASQTSPQSGEQATSAPSEVPVATTTEVTTEAQNEPTAPSTPAPPAQAESTAVTAVPAQQTQASPEPAPTANAEIAEAATDAPASPPEQATVLNEEPAVPAPEPDAPASAENEISSTPAVPDQTEAARVEGGGTEQASEPVEQELTPEPETAAVEPQPEAPEEILVAPIADIETETEPAPFVGAAGTESEIAVPVPPSVPDQPASASAEVASSNASGDNTTVPSSRITINARNDSWIEVRDTVADDVIFTGLLSAGDTYDVPDRPGLVFLTGNAGALDIVVDGTTVPSIGGNGVVLSGVVLEAERLKAGTAVTN